MRRHSAAALLGLGCLLLAGCSDQTAPSGMRSDAGPDLAVTHNTWITRKDMWNTERTDFATATVPNAAGQSVVYVIGGRGASNVGLTSVMAYNVATNTWTLKSAPPLASVRDERSRCDQRQDLHNRGVPVRIFQSSDADV